MFVIGIGTASPERSYAQKDCWRAFEKSDLAKRLEPRSRAIVKKVLTGNNGIATRRLALEKLSDAFDPTPDRLHQRFLEHAPKLAAEAAQRALQQANLKPADIDAVLISTCTGYTCPGLTSYVAGRLGLRPDVFALDLVGQGCGAALPNLRTAEALLASRRCDRVLSVCVEVCSAALYFDNDPGVLISACLFGDAAGAAVLARKHAGGKNMIEWKLGDSFTKPSDRDLLRFEQKDGMLRNILTPQVPQLAAGHASTVFEKAMRSSGVDRSKITGWVLHPGGRDVLSALRERLGLTVENTRWSQTVLENFGNLSSASVFFVLEAAFADSAQSGYWWMSSFGAGFSCHGALLEVTVG
jgi:predicted naringenin-chalcone synthase